MSYFSVSLPILSFGSSSLNYEFIRREYEFLKNLKKSVMRLGEKPISALKISVTNVCRFQYFADIYIKIVLLGQNSSERITFCSVEYFKAVLKL